MSLDIVVLTKHEFALTRREHNVTPDALERCPAVPDVMC
jgi:hypothetical protein